MCMAFDFDKKGAAVKKYRSFVEIGLSVGRLPDFGTLFPIIDIVQFDVIVL